MRTIEAQDYKVYIGKYVFTALTEYLQNNIYSKIFILADENTMQFCLPELIVKVPKLEKAEIIETESGEENKNIDVAIQIWKVLTELKADRKSLLINLGGGVISDMGGFIASAFKRGIDYINIPTTLLAQVDASVGGKTGIDLDHYKNQIGFFSNPKAVFIYPPFLNTLSKRLVLSGMAESLKHALIADGEYWKQLRKFKPALPDWDSIIERSVEIKNDIVKTDPEEKNIRKSLNFGHTIGHALETIYLDAGEPLQHGEAIAAGMFCESYLSYKSAGLPHAVLDDICAYLLKLYKPLNMKHFDPAKIIEIIKHDKKNENGQVLFSLISDIGKAVINKKCSTEVVNQALEFYRMRAMLIKSKN
jgi:3-dehydroquinate synthase